MKSLSERPEDIITNVTKIADFLGVNRAEVYGLIKYGKIRPIQVYRGDRIFDLKEIEKLKEKYENKLH